MTNESENKSRTSGDQPANNATAINNLKEKHKNEKVAEAHEQADADMEQDPDLAEKNDPNADLDEGELARAEGDDAPVA